MNRRTKRQNSEKKTDVKVELKRGKRRKKKKEKIIVFGIRILGMVLYCLFFFFFWLFFFFFF